MKKTFHEEATELSNAMHELLDLFCERIGVVWLADKLASLLGQWDRQDQTPKNKRIS